MNDLEVLRKRCSAQYAAPQTREYVEALEAEVERLTLINKRLEAALVRQGEQYAAEAERLHARIPDPDDLKAAVTACEFVADDLHSASGGRSENIAPWRERAARLRATLEVKDE
jgi:hypothetical protein